MPDSTVARRRLLSARAAVGFTLATGVAISLQGCSVTPTAHLAAAWETKPSYWTNFNFYAPGNFTPVLGSCSLPNLPPEFKCNGHGTCKAWNTSAVVQPNLYFCLCDKDWADPECRTRRKSQTTAYLLSLFGGFLGLDRFYLGDRMMGLVKLFTLGGAGVWWAADIARIGSSPVYVTGDPGYRVAADLDHGIYVFVTISVFVLLGYIVFNFVGAAVEEQNKKARLLRRTEDKFFREKGETVEIDETDETESDYQYTPITFHPLHRRSQREYVDLIPTGLGNYGSTGVSHYALTGQREFAPVPGGPFRNANYFNAMGGGQTIGP